MTDTLDPVPASFVAGRPSAGARLKAAREAAGLSIDAVAQQLKLAPRQVKALEEDDWPRLPGRTFVRGFSRNYARFVHLDPDAVLALLPAQEVVPALERPALAASRRPMGEIPVERATKASGTRWLILLLLVIVIVAAAFYEISKSGPHLLFGATRPGVTAAPSSTTTAPASPPAAPGGTVTSALPNPISGTTSSPVSTVAASGTTAPATSVAAPPIDTRATDTHDATAAPLVLAFRGSSWVEVKDAQGRTVMQLTGGAGMTQTVTAVPPLELALGNAPEVDVTFRGQRIDLGPYRRGNVVRVALQ